MYVHGVAVDDACALAREIVLEFLHRAFVAGDDRGRKHYRVALFNFYVLVGLDRDTHEGRELVTLSTGCKDYGLVVGS